MKNAKQTKKSVQPAKAVKTTTAAKPVKSVKSDKPAATKKTPAKKAKADTPVLQAAKPYELDDMAMKLARKHMSAEKVLDRMNVKTEQFPQRISAVDAYAMSKFAFIHNLKSLSDAAYTLRHSKLTLDDVISSFDSRDWNLIAHGAVKFIPKK